MSRKKSKLDTNIFFQMIKDVNRDFPDVKMVGTTLREVESANRHQWGAVLWYDGKQYISPTCDLNVIDRIGGGDGFASGLIYGMINGRDPQEAVNLGWAHGALLTTFPGDVTMAKLPEVETFAKGGTARVQR
jgi:2-dehydro-3-deoxygluconokinase